MVLHNYGASRLGPLPLNAHGDEKVSIRLSHCNLRARDLDEALAFYRDVIGLEVRADIPLKPQCTSSTEQTPSVTRAGWCPCPRPDAESRFRITIEPELETAPPPVSTWCGLRGAGLSHSALRYFKTRAMDFAASSDLHQ